MNLAANPGRKRFPYLPQLLLFVLLVAAGLTWMWWVCRGDWVVQVNGAKISKAQLDAEFERMRDFFRDFYGIDFSGEEGEKLMGQLRRETLGNLIDRLLLRQAAERSGIRAEASEVDAQLAEDRLQAGGPEAFEELLRDSGLTVAEYRRRVAEGIAIQKLQRAVIGSVTVEEEEIRQAYQEQKDLLLLPERVNVGHILLKTREEALEVIRSLEEGGDFQELAVERSTDPSVAENRGVLGYIRRDDPGIAEAFLQEAFRLQPGEFSREPVKTEFGYHVLYCFERIPAGPARYEEVRETLEQELLGSKKNRAFMSYLEGLRKNCRLLYNPKFPAYYGIFED
ncbi:MAG: hypothetical protein PWQ39_507 [Thermacetogenium sp.]|nr:hypothetical protein [Thermacetogenium sp.]